MQAPSDIGSLFSCTHDLKREAVALSTTAPLLSLVSTSLLKHLLMNIYKARFFFQLAKTTIPKTLIANSDTYKPTSA